MLRKISVCSLWMVLFCLLIPVIGSGADQNRQLRLGLLPIADVLPVYVALEKGYFTELGITVEALPVGSALERDQLMQAGRIDGMINEIAGSATFNRDAGRVKIVSIARSPIGDSPLFRIVAAPGSKVEKISELANIPIGISMNTVIEYITTRLLTGGGVAPQDISYQSVPVLPERLQLLLSGQLKLATLPDPLGASAIKAGAVEIVNDTAESSVSASVVTFTNEALEQKTETVKAFMAAWDRACGDLNESPNSFQGLLRKKIRIPKNVEADYKIPPMPRKAVPSKAQWDDVMAWMVDKKLLASPLVYEESVTADFLAR